MIRSELIERVAGKAAMPRHRVEDAVLAMLGELAAALIAGRPILLRGIASLAVVRRGRRKVRKGSPRPRHRKPATAWRIRCRPAKAVREGLGRPGQNSPETADGGISAGFGNFSAARPHACERGSAAPSIVAVFPPSRATGDPRAGPPLAIARGAPAPGRPGRGRPRRRRAGPDRGWRS